MRLAQLAELIVPRVTPSTFGKHQIEVSLLPELTNGACSPSRERFEQEPSAWVSVTTAASIAIKLIMIQYLAASYPNSYMWLGHMLCACKYLLPRCRLISEAEISCPPTMWRVWKPLLVKWRLQVRLDPWTEIQKGTPAMVADVKREG